MSKRFSLAEARDLIPYVGGLLREAVKLKSEYQKVERAIHALSGQITLMGGMSVDRSRFTEYKAQRERCAGELRQAIDRINELGCLVKDLDTGLIDFPTTFRGEEVYPCWRLGETDIDYWHGVDEGFAGRKRIDQDFLEHHAGDPRQ